MNVFKLRQNFAQESVKNGVIEGVAYSGEVIPYYCGYENFVIDLNSLSFSKKKIPLLRDHMTELVAGHSEVKLEDNQLNIKGTISKKTPVGQEIIALSEDGFEWELSVGVYDASIEEGFTGEVNGREVENAVVLRNGLLREVSVVALGADRHTSANIFQNKESLKMNEKDFKLLVSKLGLSTKATINEIIAKLEVSEEALQEVAAKEETIETLNETIEVLNSKIEELEEEIAEIKEEEAVEERTEEIKAAIQEKGITLSVEKIKSIAKSKESTDMFLEAVKEMKVEKKIDPKFSKKFNVEGSKPSNTTVTLRDQANAMVKEGKAKDFMTALSLLQGANNV